MLGRCLNPRHPEFRNYGGRGISVSPRWRAFTAFLDDMGPRPNGATLERVDVNGHYAPDNCRWATPAEQANNRRNNRFLEHDGLRLTVAQWARRLRCNRSALLHRLNAGWPVAEALAQPFSREAHGGRRRLLLP